MSIVSYAQNFEDVMLWRALGHVTDGFYIDIGAQDAVVDSVSKAFHEQGWRGVHVEPATGYAEQLRQQRPGDDIRQVAVGRHRGKLTLYEVSESGLSTGDPDIAEAYRQEGREVEEIIVDMITLDDLFGSLCRPVVHWLKIDVEGMEADVIAGWNESTVRPWLVIVESTRPGSQEETYQKWEPQLLAKGYEAVYFDGLNRFYLSAEHPELRAAFESPPNVFDRFVLSGKASQSFCQQVQHETWQAEERGADFARQAYEANNRLNSLEGELARLRQQADKVVRLEQEKRALDRRVGEAEAGRHEALSQLESVYRSKSWRYTMPLRKLVAIARYVRSGSPGLRSRTSGVVNNLVYAGVYRVGASPRLKALGLRLLRACPPLFNQIRVRFHQGAMARNSEAFTVDSPFGASRLSQRQQNLKHQLEAAISSRHQQE